MLVHACLTMRRVLILSRTLAECLHRPRHAVDRDQITICSSHTQHRGEAISSRAANRRRLRARYIYPPTAHDPVTTPVFIHRLQIMSVRPSPEFLQLAETHISHLALCPRCGSRVGPPRRCTGNSNPEHKDLWYQAVSGCSTCAAVSC